MGVARILKDDRDTMGEQPMYRPSQGHSQAQTKLAPAVAGRTRRGEDPLAELARLIGQEDPFKEFDAAPRRAPANGNAAPQAAAPRPERRPVANGAGARVPAATRPAEVPRQPVLSRPVQPATRPVPQAAPAMRSVERQEPQVRPVRTPVAPAPQPRTAAPSYEGYDRPVDPRFGREAETRPLERTNPRLRDEPPVSAYRQPAQEPSARRGYVPEEVPSRTRRPVQTYQEPATYEDDYDPEYDDEAYLGEHADEIYDDVEKPRRGIGFWLVGGIVVASLVAVAFLGVFAYRTIFNTPQRAAVVTKSNAPTKVEPQKNPVAVAPASNKPIQDRIGGANETQTLRREEQPLDLTQPNQPQQPVPDAARPQQPPTQVQRTPAFTPPPTQQQPQQPQQQVPANADQPKRVRTMTVRSDGSVVPSGAQQNNAPLPLNANPEPDTQTLPPQTRPNSAVPAPQTNRVAALAPSLPPVHQTATGNYVVQVASHKTPDEAQGAWQNLRQQYASILGNRNADIRKVDLGDRGTFYRAMVGPMSRDQANALCQNLKTQGAGCIVQTR